MKSQFRHISLDNGLEVLILPDLSTPLVAVNLLYQVGSKHDPAHRTGLAHLFEHLMFNNFPDDINFDHLMHIAGADANAFTTPDTTQYFTTLPEAQLELSLQLEALRMTDFSISEKNLELQKKVVIEEFYENHLSTPYGIFPHLLMRLCYKSHSYRWPVIGEKTEHIERVDMIDAREFFQQHYGPTGTILCVTGPVDIERTLALINKYFSVIPPSQKLALYSSETEQVNARHKIHRGAFPDTTVAMAFHFPARLDPDFYSSDILTDILAEGRHARLVKRLREEKPIFNEIDAYITATADSGLCVIEGKLADNTSVNQAREEVWAVLNGVKSHPPDEKEWQKIMYRMESTYGFSHLGTLNRCMNLSYAQYLGDPGLIYSELEEYKRVKPTDIQSLVENYLTPEKENCLVLTPD